MKSIIKKDKSLLHKKARIREALNNLDRDKIYILYFCYYFNWHNIYHTPLLIFTKLLSMLTKKSCVDHVCHISRFVYDRRDKIFIPKIFEATIKLGMDENDLESKLETMQGKVYIEQLGDVNKIIARDFENKFRQVPYSIKLAKDSGIDIEFLKKKDYPNGDGGFCSWLVTIFLQLQSNASKQNIMKAVKRKIESIENGNPLEITPADLYDADFSKKALFYDSKK